MAKHIILFIGKMADLESSLQEDMKELKSQITTLLKDMETLLKKRDNKEETVTEDKREFINRGESVNSI